MHSQDVVELGYTPHFRVFLVREPQFVLHVLANPLSQLGWQVLDHRLGHEIVQRRARFSIKIQDNFKLISFVGGGQVACIQVCAMPSIGF